MPDCKLLQSRADSSLENGLVRWVSDRPSGWSRTLLRIQHGPHTNWLDPLDPREVRITVSRDGVYFVTFVTLLSSCFAVCVWDGLTGDNLASFSQPSPQTADGRVFPPSCVACSPNIRYVAFAFENYHHLFIWELGTGDFGTIILAGCPVALAFTSDRKLHVVTSGSPGSNFDTAAFEIVIRGSTDNDPVTVSATRRVFTNSLDGSATAFASSSDGRYTVVATTITEGLTSIYLWKLLGTVYGKPVSFVSDSLAIRALAITTQAAPCSYLASGSDDGQVVLWSVQTSQRLGTLTGHTNPVLALDFSGEASMLASRSCRSIRLWSTSTYESLSVIPLPHAKLPLMLLVPSSRPHDEMRVFINTDDSVEMLHLGAASATSATQADPISFVTFSGDGTVFATATTRTISLWDTRTALLMGTVSMTDVSNVEDLRLSRDASEVAVLCAMDSGRTACFFWSRQQGRWQPEEPVAHHLPDIDAKRHMLSLDAKYAAICLPSALEIVDIPSGDVVARRDLDSDFGSKFDDQVLLSSLQRMDNVQIQDSANIQVIGNNTRVLGAGNIGPLFCGHGNKDLYFTFHFEGSAPCATFCYTERSSGRSINERRGCLYRGFGTQRLCWLPYERRPWLPTSLSWYNDIVVIGSRFGHTTVLKITAGEATLELTSFPEEFDGPRGRQPPAPATAYSESSN
ncbi:WD40 repeat-like protein [Exidia glandulosa HHB12029]|uniref:WD40 repeat-like protein n=1 Tax=Exidia glandulosa HHB12029 TaxID=1314781 RepID=A0A165EUU9_EXIGL|nr:WD40 repeat-like protein [Exidia glandulosa HHB12029]